MPHLGDFAAGAVLYGSFTTYRPSTGAAFALAGTPILSVYKDDSATQWGTVISVANGTLSNPDSLAGFNVWKLDTSADGTFFAAGHVFHIVVTTGTVDSVDIAGSVVATFTLGMGQSTALRPTTAGRTLDVSAGGEAGVDWGNVGSPTTTLDLSGTTIATTQKVDVDTIKTNPVANGGTVTFPTNATLASTTNITAAAGVALSATQAAYAPAKAGDAMAITAGQTVDTVTTLTNLPAITAGWLTATGIAAGALDNKGNWNVGKTGYSLSQAFPTNFADLAITVTTGKVTVGTNDDKTGYTASTVSDKTGYSINGTIQTLDALATHGDSTWATATGFSTLDASGIRSAVGLASADLDTQLAALPTATENADALLNRDMSAVSDTNARSPLNALRFLRNKWSISGATLTVTKEDDTAAAWTATVSTSAGADPVVGNDPA